VATRAGLDVVAYEDDAVGEMPGDVRPQRITRITLRPVVTLAGEVEPGFVERLLHEGHEQCYIANSLTTEVVLEPTIRGAVSPSA
jgi:organic hydroperoxide reductase OsmC/OhrA